MVLFSVFLMNSIFFPDRFFFISTHSVLDVRLFSKRRCSFCFRYFLSGRIQKFTHIFRYFWARSHVLSDRPLSPITRSLHKCRPIFPSAELLTSTSTLVYVDSNVFNRTTFFHMIFVKLFILFTQQLTHLIE